MGPVKTRRLAAMQKQQRAKAGMQPRSILKNKWPQVRSNTHLKGCRMKPQETKRLVAKSEIPSPRRRWQSPVPATPAPPDDEVLE